MKMFKKLFMVFLLFALLAVTVPAMAAIDLTGITLDVAPVHAFIGIILIAIAAIWPIKKLIAMGNKS